MFESFHIKNSLRVSAKELAVVSFERADGLPRSRRLFTIFNSFP